MGGAERGRGALSSDRLAGLHEGSQAVRGLPAAAALSRGSRAQGAPTPEESPWRRPFELLPFVYGQSCSFHSANLLFGTLWQSIFKSMPGASQDPE